MDCPAGGARVEGGLISAGGGGGGPGSLGGGLSGVGGGGGRGVGWGRGRGAGVGRARGETSRHVTRGGCGVGVGGGGGGRRRRWSPPDARALGWDFPAPSVSPETPLVQLLAAVPHRLLGPDTRRGHIAIQRHAHVEDHLGHLLSPWSEWRDVLVAAKDVVPGLTSL